MPKGDILIIAGDLTMLGELEEIIRLNYWLGTLPHSYKIIIAGNHDGLFQNSPTYAQSLITNATYLEDSQTEIDGLKIYGSPWQPEYMSMAFNLPRGQALIEKWAMIPQEVDILITHGPPYGILDEVPDGKRVGCNDLLDAVRRTKPQLHIFGHIHHSYGHLKAGSTDFANASICDESYCPSNLPLVFDL